MNIFPSLDDVVVGENLKSEEKLGTLEPLFDFKKNKIVTKEGKVVMASWKEQIQQWITLLIKTEVNKFNVYVDTEFGMTDLYSLRGQQFLFTNFGISEVKRELREKIETDPRIEEVKNINVKSSFNALKIEMTVTTRQEPQKRERVKNEFELLDISFDLNLEGEVMNFEWLT